MSKKKNKFKRSKKSHSERIAVEPTPAISVNLENVTGEPVVDQAVAAAPTPKEDDFYATDQYDHVRRDIKIVLALLLGIVVILFVVYYLGLKTSFLTTVGDWFYKILNIQTR